MPRAERRIKTIAGSGGAIAIYHARFEPGQQSAGAPPAPGSPESYLPAAPYGGAGGTYHPLVAGLLDVSRWQVRHKQLSVDITHSGSFGAIKRAVVARDWSFACQCPWHSQMGGRTSQGVLLGFLEQILTGHSSTDYNIGIEFYLGDPLNYGDPQGNYVPEEVAFLRAPLALAEDFNTACDATGKDVVRIDFTGLGNSLLEGYRGVLPSVPRQEFPMADAMRTLYNL